MIVFQDTVFNFPWHAHLSVAEEWLSAGGLNDIKTIKEALEESTDKELAAECDEAWGMSEPYEDDDPYNRENWFDIDELVLAFAEIRENPEERFRTR